MSVAALNFPEGWTSEERSIGMVRRLEQVKREIVAESVARHAGLP